MIPKIIHFCWLSDDPYPEIIQKCMDSWKEYLNDYEFIKWDLRRFDINSVQYVKDAYTAKKYAFCADYIRMYALYTMGGIYLDSDVLVHKSLDPFLKYRSFSSVEFHDYLLYANVRNKREKLVGIEAAVIGAEKGEQWLNDVMEYMKKQTFNPKQIDKMIMPRVIARILHNKYGFEYYPRYQMLENGFLILPTEVLSAKYVDHNCPIKYTSHLGANSWGYKTNMSLLKRCIEKIGIAELIRKIRGIKHI